MAMYIKAIVTLIITVFILSVFLFLQISQRDNIFNISPPYQFVVGRQWEYCYIKGHHRKDLDIIVEFSTIEQCEDYLFDQTNKNDIN